MFRLDGVGGPQRSSGFGLFKADPLLVAHRSNGTTQSMTLEEAREHGLRIDENPLSLKKILRRLFAVFKPVS